MDSILGDGAHVNLPGGVALYVDVLDSILGDGAHVNVPGGVALYEDVLDSLEMGPTSSYLEV